MVEVTYQMILSTLQTTGILVGIAYYIMTLNYTRKNQEITLRNQEETLKTRKISIFHQTFGSLITSPYGNKNIRILDYNIASDIEEFRELTIKNPEFFEAWRWAFDTLDISGIYLKEGVFDIAVFAKFNPWWFIQLWKQYKPIIDEQRRSGVNVFLNVDLLMDSLQKYIDEHPELYNR